jgi:Mn-dependent DtxR family transcriptional regulator
MNSSDRQITDEDVLEVFDEFADPGEPLATSEVAERLDCAHRTAYNKLDALAERKEIESKENRRTSAGLVATGVTH